MAQQQPLIVVVEDDSSMRQATQRLLTAAGYRVRAFESAEALRAANCAQSADCLVLDMRLPGQSGPAWYGSLERPRPPAVFITAHDGSASRRIASQAGARGFLAKPFAGSALLDLVANVVPAGGRQC